MKDLFRILFFRFSILYIAVLAIVISSLTNCKSLPQKSVDSIRYDSEKQYWVARPSKNLFLFNTNQITEYPIRDNVKKSILRRNEKITLQKEESEIYQNWENHNIDFKEKNSAYFDNDTSFYINSLASKRYFRGLSSLTNHDYSNAIFHFEKALSFNPDLTYFSDIHFLLGYSYFKTKTPQISNAKKYFKQFLDYSEKNISDSFYKNHDEFNDDYSQKILYAKKFLNSVNSKKNVKDYSFDFSPKYRQYFYNHFLIYGYNYDNRLGKSLTLPYYYQDHIGHHAGLMNVFNWHSYIDSVLLLQFIGVDYQIFLGVPIQIFKTPKEDFSIQIMPKGYLAYQEVSEGNTRHSFYYYNVGVGFSFGYYIRQNLFLGFKSDWYWYHFQNKKKIPSSENISTGEENSDNNKIVFSQWSNSFFDIKVIYFITRTIGLQSSFSYDYFLPSDHPKKKGLKMTLYYDPFSLGISYDILQNEFSLNFITFYNYHTQVH